PHQAKRISTASWGLAAAGAVVAWAAGAGAPGAVVGCAAAGAAGFAASVGFAGAGAWVGLVAGWDACCPQAERIASAETPTAPRSRERRESRRPPPSVTPAMYLILVPPPRPTMGRYRPAPT